MPDWKSIAKILEAGDAVKCRPRGNSMAPRIKSGQLITIIPDVAKVEVDYVVFCKVNGSFFVHLVSAIGQDGRFQISNNRGHVNGTRSVFGKVVLVEE